jgi:hypothetical protein
VPYLPLPRPALMPLKTMEDMFLFSTEKNKQNVEIGRSV